MRVCRSLPCKGYGFRHRGASVSIVFTSRDEDRGVDMLAVLTASLVVGARALRVCLRKMPDRVNSLAALRGNNPAIPMLVNLLRGRNYDSALLSQVFHSNLAYLRGILLIRYILVKDIFVKIYLDGILLSGISSRSWEWSTSRKRAINALAALMNGCPVEAPWESLGYAPSAKAPTGINREKTRQKRDNTSVANLAERGGIEPPSASARTRRFCRPLHCHSAISPLNRPGGESSAQTFAPHSVLKSILLETKANACNVGEQDGCTTVAQPLRTSLDKDGCREIGGKGDYWAGSLIIGQEAVIGQSHVNSEKHNN